MAKWEAEKMVLCIAHSGDLVVDFVSGYKSNLA